MRNNSGAKRGVGGLWEQITAKLDGGYLLVFAICALFFLVAIGSSVVGVFKAIRSEGAIEYFGLSVISLAISLLTAIQVVKIIETPAISTSISSKNSVETLPDSGKIADIKKSLLKLNENIIEASKYNHEILFENIYDRISIIQGKSSLWSQGCLRIDDVEYKKILLKVYENSSMVFSTVIPEYYELLVSLEDELLEIRARNNSEMTRIFLFNSEIEMDNKFKRMMKRLKESGIDIYYIIDDQNEIKLKDLPARDFAIINNGEAIAITEAFNPEAPRAAWYFNSEQKKSEFMPWIDKLKRSATKY
jgi:hypothetical protein